MGTTRFHNTGVVMKQIVENGKYEYVTSEVDQLVISGSHDTIASITVTEALIFAKNLISAAQKPLQDGTVTINFEMKQPERLGDSPRLVLATHEGGYISPKLHWSLIEGHSVYSLVNNQDA
jgi:hypothetical protein